MSSPPAFVLSSPPSVGGPRRARSRFTYKQLAQLANYAPTSPLRVIALIDLDAFYAQCERIRLGLPEAQPLAVRQWDGLIAVNYPARAAGCTRFIDIKEAKRLCPDLILQHVATWQEGDDKWAYRDDVAPADIATHKVSLDPYRKCSRDIFACIRAFLPPAPRQRVEKASVDEVFMDLSAHVHAVLLERYPELRGPPPYDDPTEALPPLPTTALDWKADALIDLDEGQTEDDDPDWDDVAILVASEIVRDVRAEVRAKLGFTCSGGIARNKMLAKLGAGHKKPNQQTVIRNRAVGQFLGGYKFTKIRMLGGKLGEQVSKAFGTEEVKDLWAVSLEQLKAKLDDDTGAWLYKLVRGEEHSEVNARTHIKSMLSAKSFRPAINDAAAATRWLRIFVADIYARLVEEGVVENRRRPRTINLHHRQGGVVRSRQLPIPASRRITDEALLDLAKTLLGQVIIDGRAWPCSNLSLSVGGFEDGVTGNRGIGSFLVKGDEAKAMNSSKLLESREREDSPSDVPGSVKRLKTDDGIQRFFAKPTTPAAKARDEDVATLLSRDPAHAEPPYAKAHAERTALFDQNGSDVGYQCLKCHETVALEDQGEHEDWHFAKQLEAEERKTNAGSTSVSSLSREAGAKRNSTSGKPLRGRPKRSAGAGVVGDRQTRLAFSR